MKVFKRSPAAITGLTITFVFLWLGLFRVGFLDNLELRLYDVRMSLRGDSSPSGDIILVNIDDDSIERLGRWPWPRSILAEGLRKISAGGPRVIGLNIMLSEPEGNQALAELRGLEDLFDKKILPLAGAQWPVFHQAIVGARERLDNDRKLAGVIGECGSVVLPVFFKGAPVPGDTLKETNAVLVDQGIPNVQASVAAGCPRGGEIVAPIEPFLVVSKGAGHINLRFDPDGKARRELLLYEYRGLFVPSYALRLAASFLGVSREGIRATQNGIVLQDSAIIPMSQRAELLISFKGPGGAFKGYPYHDVMHDKVPGSLFKDKLVLVSTTAAGIMNPLSTPVSPDMHLGELSANTVWTILNRRFLQKPAWEFAAELFLILFVGMVITFVLPRMKAAVSGLTFVVLAALLLGGATYSFVARGLWLGVTYPLLELILGYMGVVTLKYFVTETGKEKIEEESAENNRMLGLSFQGQGMLDMAFDKFRRVPVDEGMKDVLYNLALDYERKRQFNKAVSVYAHIEEHDLRFKDVSERKRKLLQAEETIVLAPGVTGGEAMLSTATDTRPTLGRYELIRQLGKGAMGVVYLGQDPRINRITAIKTFHFSEDLDSDELKKMKEKFFIEAESAGTLSHPNIVTIYDAGEEQELAYIAMEYLEGENLQSYTKEGSLLPLRKVIDHVADIADALDYAHQKGIVHRDIKPANIMLLKTGTVKITDFGIARITASSQTQTGVVKGTPFYMSPEQISGQKVDGRSDIFSLGVMLYQMLTARMPFVGDNLAALMHQIMNVPPPDPRGFNPKIIKPLVDIMNKAMEKDREKRFDRASQMASLLRLLGKKIDEVVARKKTSPD